MAPLRLCKCKVAAIARAPPVTDSFERLGGVAQNGKLRGLGLRPKPSQQWSRSPLTFGFDRRGLLIFSVGHPNQPISSSMRCHNLVAVWQDNFPLAEHLGLHLRRASLKRVRNSWHQRRIALSGRRSSCLRPSKSIVKMTSLSRPRT